MVTTDPTIRLTAGGILVLAFAGCLAVVVHGYWLSSAYVIPPLLSWILGSAVTGALTLLGVHLGVGSTQTSVIQGAKVTTEALQNGRAAESGAGK